MQIRLSGIQIAGLVLVVFVLGITNFAIAGSDAKLSRGELVYVSTYSNVFVGNMNEKLQLSALLSIRNTDPKYAITITQVDYFDSDGRKIKSYNFRPMRLSPLATKFYYVEPKDTSGGAGANFIVRWEADQSVNQPIIEAVMSNLFNRQGVAFRCPGKIITDHDN